MYSRTIIVLHAQWHNVKVGEWSNPLPKTEPLVTIAVDLDQGLWVARNNWQYTRNNFLHAVTGTARTETIDLLIEHGSQMGPMRLNAYFAEGHPRREGAAFHGQHPQNPDTYAQRTQWWRYDDPSIMSPADRMAEMLDRAVKSPTLRQAIHAQFGGLASPEVLMPIVGTFLVMFGAEFVGGAAAVMTITRIMGINQLLCDYYFYEPRGMALHRICMAAASPSDLDYGAKLLEEILVQLFTDIATAVGIHMISAAAKRLFSTLMNLAPENLRQRLLANKNAAAAYIRGKGYQRRDLLKNPAGTPLEKAAINMYEKTSVEHCEVLVVREPDVQRAAWVNSKVWNRGKPPWLKASSGDGWHGLVCISESELGGGHLQSAGTYDMGNLRGASTEIDQAIAANRKVKKFEMPTDGRPINGPDGSPKIDYHYTGKHNNIDLHGHYLVEVTPGKYMVVDSMGIPYASDLDLATRQRPGMKQAGDHLQDRYQSDKKLGGAEDDMLLEYQMNRRYHETSGASPMHDPTLHGGGGATVAYTRNGLDAGKTPGKDGFWTPKRPDGYKKERLVIFVPEWENGRIKSNMYVLESWADFKEFARANGLEFPF